MIRRVQCFASRWFSVDLHALMAACVQFSMQTPACLRNLFPRQRKLYLFLRGTPYVFDAFRKRCQRLAPPPTWENITNSTIRNKQQYRQEQTGQAGQLGQAGQTGQTRQIELRTGLAGLTGLTLRVNARPQSGTAGLGSLPRCRTGVHGR